MEIKCITTISKTAKNTINNTSVIIEISLQENTNNILKKTLHPLTQNCCMLPPAKGGGAKNSVTGPAIVASTRH
jgi:hypothetical protein